MIILMKYLEILENSLKIQENSSNAVIFNKLCLKLVPYFKTKNYAFLLLISQRVHVIFCNFR